MLLPEQRAREIIDKQIKDAGWDIVSRDEYVSNCALAVKEALMQGNTESDYLLFVDALHIILKSGSWISERSVSIAKHRSIKFQIQPNICRVGRVGKG